MSEIRTIVGLPLPARSANVYQLQGEDCRRGRSYPTFSTADLGLYLQQIFKKHGRLSRAIIDSCGPPCAFTFVERYGSLSAAYADAGYQPDANQKMRLG